MPERDPAGGWRHLGWSWTVRHGRVIGVGYGAFALCLGGALGFVPGLISGDWESTSAWVQLWVAIGLVAAALAALALAEILRRGRDRMIQRNGTAYILDEVAEDWDDDEPAQFREGIRRQFARVVEVPGPDKVGRAWRWPLDGSARNWEEKLAELVRAFRVLNIHMKRSAPAAPNGIFIRAWWAVACAFGMRVTGADRGLKLDVWQRPGNGRAGTISPTVWGQRPHRFTGEESLGDGLRTREYTWPVELTVARHARDLRSVCDLADLSILLVRYNRHPWGSPALLSGGDATPGLDPLSIHLKDAVGLARPGTVRTEIHEFRCVPPNGETFDWPDFPGLTANAVDWIELKTKELGDRTYLMAAAMANEIALGIGIVAGQESRRASWPTHLWPVVFQPGTRDLIIPNLDLGTASLDILGTDRRQR